MMPSEVGANPYPGLRPFETEEDDLFFGRDGQSEDILASLRRHRLVAVVGVSGSGKSSLIRAGLLSYLYGGFMSGASSHWRVAVMRPGGDPIHNLSEALHDPSVLGRPGTSEEEARQEQILLEVTLRRSGLGLIEAVRQARLPEVDNLLVVVDQFEELFRFAEPSKSIRNDDDAAAFVKLLIESSAQEELPIYVVLTMRSDFIGDCARYRDLPEAVAAGLYLIPRMTRDDRREAIERPARVAGSEIAPRLMNRLLNEGGDNPDQLPILQHALMRTWEYWRHHREPGEPIDLDDYKAIGEMSEALSLHAEEAYAELPGDRSREIAKRMFQALTEKGEDNREIRRPTSVATIAAIAGADIAEVIVVIEHFREGGRSFLTPSVNVPLTAASVIDISHESLIRGWQRLNKWVDEEAESAKVYRRLAETAALHAQGRAALWDNEDLSYALAWREKEKPNPEWGKCYNDGFQEAMSFLDQSQAAHLAALAEQQAFLAEQQRIKRAARHRNLALAACLILLACALLLLHERRERKDAQLEAQMAQNALTEERDRDQAREQHAQEEAKLKQMQAISEQNRQQAEWVRNVASTGDEQRIETASLANNVSSSVNEMVPPSQRIVLDEAQGEALGYMGDHEQAVQEYTAALLLQPDDGEIRQQRGYEYILLGRATDALNDFNSYLKVDPHSSSARLNVVIALAMLRRYHEAETALEQAIKDYQFKSDSMFDSEISPDIYRATGQNLLSTTFPGFRIAMFYEAATLRAFAGDPDFLKALDRADNMARKDGFYPAQNGAAGARPAGSVDPFLVSIEWAWLSARAQGTISGRRNAEDYGVYAVYGALWERAGRMQPRFTDWAGHFYSAFQQTYRSHRDRRYDGLAAFVDQRLQALYPGSGQPPPIPDEIATDTRKLEDEAKVLEDRQDYAGEAETLSQAIQMIEQQPENRSQLIVLLLKRAEAYRALKNYKQTREDCKRVLAMEPHMGEAYMYLGDAETNKASQQRDYELAVQYAPSRRFAKTRLADAIADKDPKRALQLLREADRMGPPDSWIYKRMAGLQNEEGDYRGGLVSANAALGVEPNDSDAYELKERAEAGIGLNSAEISLDRASALRSLADHLARTGKPDEALSLYLDGLRALAVDTAGKENEDARAEERVEARDISDMLERLGSRTAVKSFWTTIGSNAYFHPIGDIAQHEVQRLSTP